MATPETNGDGRAINPSGVYRHPDTGEELVTQATAKFGNPAADAIVRLGFVYVGPADSTKLTPSADPSAAPLANTTPSLKTVAELESELATAKERAKLVESAQSDDSSLTEEAPKKAAPAKAEAPKDEAKGAK